LTTAYFHTRAMVSQTPAQKLALITIAAANPGILSQLARPGASPVLILQSSTNRERRSFTSSKFAVEDPHEWPIGRSNGVSQVLDRGKSFDL
jgi:hypothetical protein